MSGIPTYDEFLKSYFEAEKNGASKTALNKMERDYRALSRANRRAERDHEKAEADRIKHEFGEATAAQKALLIPLAPRLTEIWRSLDDGQYHNRKPPIGLRLPAVGAVGRLAVFPGFDKNEGIVLTGVHHAELMVDRDSDGRSMRVLKLRFTDRDVRSTLFYHKRVLADIPIVINTILMLLDDPSGYFDLMRPDRCVLCGRVLTDPSSLARGVGPECVNALPWFKDVFGSSDMKGKGATHA